MVVVTNAQTDILSGKSQCQTNTHNTQICATHQHHLTPISSSKGISMLENSRIRIHMHYILQHFRDRLCLSVFLPNWTQLRLSACVRIVCTVTALHRTPNTECVCSQHLQMRTAVPCDCHNYSPMLRLYKLTLCNMRAFVPCTWRTSFCCTKTQQLALSWRIRSMVLRNVATQMHLDIKCTHPMYTQSGHMQTE